LEEYTLEEYFWFMKDGKQKWQCAVLLKVMLVLYRPERAGTAERQQIKQGVNKGDENIEIKNKKLNVTG